MFSDKHVSIPGHGKADVEAFGGFIAGRIGVDWDGAAAIFVGFGAVCVLVTVLEVVALVMVGMVALVMVVSTTVGSWLRKFVMVSLVDECGALSKDF